MTKQFYSDNHNSKIYDILGVGIGVFNMSAAALLAPVKNISYEFIEKKLNFQWHSNTLLPESYLQTHYLDDLVTSIDPTNPYSFLSFIVKKRRFHAFINCNFSFIHRAEFIEYLDWASKIIPNLSFGEEIEKIDFRAGSFFIQSNKRTIRSNNIILGTGTKPYIPDWAIKKICKRIYHNNSFLLQEHNWQEKRVVIIGGGQSGAEIMHYILSSEKNNYPRELTWISSRSLFLPLDNSPFTGELFNSSYIQYFYNWTLEQRKCKLNEQLLASDGISLNLLSDLYRLIYRLKIVEKIKTEIVLLPDHQVSGLESNNNSNGSFSIFSNNIIDGNKKVIDADVIILCTGNKPRDFTCLDQNLTSRFCKDGNQFKININYSIIWDGPANMNIYVQNYAKQSHGITDSNIPLITWRSATIINSILRKNVYDTSHENSVVIDWSKVYKNTDFG